MLLSIVVPFAAMLVEIFDVSSRPVGGEPLSRSSFRCDRSHFSQLVRQTANGFLAVTLCMVDPAPQININRVSHQPINDTGWSKDVMENWKAQLNGNGSNVDPQTRAFESLNQNGSSHFVDAIRVRRFKQMFRHRSNIPVDGNGSFWDEVSTNLGESVRKSKI